ncbi:MAG: transcription antitermination factor NusB [Myxococcota bacterium]|nr:transcription antitermination factor NusB [Myxococcota bacterium]
MGSRRRAREAALQMLYQMDVAAMGADEAIARYWDELATERDGESFANELVRGVERERERIDALIRGVSEHWRLERMACVDRNILRLGVYELLAVPDVPRRVTLNEAIELAKRFGAEGSAAFVNGVLDRIAADLGKP